MSPAKPSRRQAKTVTPGCRPARGRAGVGPVPPLGIDHQVEVRLVGRDAHPVVVPRAGQRVGGAAADQQLIFAVRRGREAVRRRVLAAREEFRG